MDSLDELVTRARQGDLDAFGALVQATQVMAYAAARGVLREPALAEDAAQDAYLKAFRRLRELEEPAAFITWLRRIVITTALNVRRSRRRMWLQLDGEADVPVLDEVETTWSAGQRQRLASALLTLTADERRLCDRRYYGGWSTARLARDAGTDEAAMRKRLQRIRDKLRREIEVTERRGVRPDEIHADFPAKVLELLAQPQLTDLPENPVGRVTELLRGAFADFEERALPEVVNFADARESIGAEALYIDAGELHRVDDQRILRYDLTLPLLLTTRYDGRPLKLWARGKAYRACQADATHLEAFHQAEVFWLDEHATVDGWRMTARVLQAIDRVLPGRPVKIVPTQYAMCKQAWDLEVEEENGRWSEVLAWGVFTDRMVSHIGGDPSRHTAVGVGVGLERLAMLRYGIDDIRRMDVSRVA